jgi:hypothetical protein
VRVRVPTNQEQIRGAAMSLMELRVERENNPVDVVERLASAA